MSDKLHEPQIFNHPDRFIEGWYWLLRSTELKRGQIKAVSLLGRDLAVYRTLEGTVVAVDAYCPHMGAHLAEGRVEDGGVRCFFHNWKFAPDGSCVEIPCLGKSLPIELQTWPTAEAYGLIWLWTGSQPKQSLPFVPELEHENVDFSLSNRFIKNCHPNVVMVNAIDAHHFNTVHNFPIKIVLESAEINQNAITFSNTTRGGGESWLIRLLQPFYKEAETYSICYWYGSTSTVTLGPDFLPFYLMIALRLRENGQTEGQTILMTKRRSGWHGWLWNRLALWIAKLTDNYFAKGDSRIFKTIKFNFKTPIRADNSIIEFIHHLERQPALMWGTWGTISTENFPIDSLQSANLEQDLSPQTHQREIEKV